MDPQSSAFLWNNINYIFSILECRDPVLPSPVLNRQILTYVIQLWWKLDFNKYKWSQDWDSDDCNKALCPSPLEMFFENLRYWSSDPRTKLSRRAVISKEEVFLIAKFSSATRGAHLEARSLQQRLHTSWGIWKEEKKMVLKGCYIPTSTITKKKNQIKRPSDTFFQILFITTYCSISYAWHYAGSSQLVLELCQRRNRIFMQRNLYNI